MEIIKPGNPKAIKRIKRFTCEYCGCIFEAEKGEYKCTDGFAMQHDQLDPYNCVCPTCGSLVYGK